MAPANTYADVQLQKSLLQWSRGLIWLVMVMSISVLAGWALDIEYLKRPIPRLVGMNPLTAICLGFFSISFFLFTTTNKSAIKVQAGTALTMLSFIFGGIRFFSILANYDLPFDIFLFRAEIDKEYLMGISNRMAPNTAFNIMLTSVSLILVNSKKENIRAASLYTSLLVGFFAFLSLLGYIYRVEEFHKLLVYIPMAVHTALCFLCISLSILFIHPNEGIMRKFTTSLAGSTTAKILIPAAVLVPVILGYLRLLGEWYHVFTVEFGVTILVTSIVLTYFALISHTAKLLNRKDEHQRETENKLYELNKTLETQVDKLEETKIVLHASLEKEIELNEMKSKFVSIASHEFRTPLATILSSVYLVKQYIKLEEPDKQEKHIEKIIGSINNLTQILDDFLSLNKLEEGKIHCMPKEFNIKSSIGDTIQDMQSILKEKQSIIYRHAGKETVILDSNLLRNILVNLLSNAIKFSDEGKEIVVESWYADNHVSISVTDSGIGISDDDMKYLFQRFFRANNALNIQGTGLGLNIVAKYTELMGGNINVTSKLNRGTTFLIDFPQEEV